MESSSSDEDDCQVEYWNNWVPPTTDKLDEVKYKPSGNRVPMTRENLFNLSRVALITSGVENSKFGNWIPPTNFLIPTNRDVQNPVSKGNQSVAEISASENVKVNRTVKEVLENGTNTSTCATPWRKKVNFDWGERTELHDVTKFNDGDMIWGVVHLGIFGNIKLWVNEYGNMCCLACGKISKLGSSEITYISISNAELLRKMLCISSSQWASLCETVKETKSILKFDAFQDCDLAKRTPLERLWFFICKRRQFLPKQCMLVKFSGAVKCMRKLEITPKLLVQDIRSIEDVFITE